MGGFGIFFEKRPWIAREDGEAQAQCVVAVGGVERGEQPLAEKSGAAGEENSRAAQRVQIGRGAAHDLVQVFARDAEHGVYDLRSGPPCGYYFRR